MNETAASPPPVIDPGDYEAEHRKMAQAIEHRHPNWLVMWGSYTRQYVAFPLFHAPAGMMICSAEPKALCHRMSYAESMFRPVSGRDNPC